MYVKEKLVNGLIHMVCHWICGIQSGALILSFALVFSQKKTIVLLYFSYCIVAKTNSNRIKKLDTERCQWMMTNQSINLTEEL